MRTNSFFAVIPLWLNASPKCLGGVGMRGELQGTLSVLFYVILSGVERAAER